MVSRKELRDQDWGFRPEASPWRIIPDINLELDQFDADFEKGFLQVNLQHSDLELLQQAIEGSAEGYVEAVIDLAQMDSESAFTLLTTMFVEFREQIWTEDTHDSLETWIVGLAFLSSDQLQELKQQATEETQALECLAILDALTDQLEPEPGVYLGHGRSEQTDDHRKFESVKAVFEHGESTIVLQPIEEGSQEKAVVYQKNLFVY